jgi:hypothetical protein
MSERVCCPECKSSRVKQSQTIAEVQRVFKEKPQDGPGYVETGTGKKHCYFIYNCLDCGKEFYEEIRKGLVS